MPTPGGGWLLSYHQENADPAARDTMFTNRGLMRCIADRVPVGVLRAPDPVTRTIVVSKLLAGTQYEALSTLQLADPVAVWQRPNQEALEIIWQRFREAEDNR